MSSACGKTELDICYY